MGQFSWKVGDILDSRFSAFILNQEFVQTWPLDTFSAFIWVERYWEAGEFQLEVPWTLDSWTHLKVGNYIYLRGHKELMIIETLGLTYDVANKANRKIVAKGRSMSSILDRRIVWGGWSYNNADFQEAMLELVKDSIVDPADERRKIDIFALRKNPDYPSELYSGSGYGDGIYETIQAACQERGSGFRTIYDDDTGLNTFELYRGVDRSYEQEEVTPVIFSSAYENLGPTRYAFQTQDYKTVAYGRGSSDSGYTTVEVGMRELTGLDRREMFVSAGETEPAAISQKTLEALTKVNTLEALDAELDSNRQFSYGTHYFVGDIVQVITDFGLDVRARVTEFMRSWDESGYSETPVFEIMNQL